MNNFSYTATSKMDAVHVNASSVGDVLYLLTKRQVTLCIPVLCFIFLLMLVAIGGNSLVIITYMKRLEKSSTNLFIFCLAVFDLINCCLAIPLEFHDLLNPYENDHSFLCAFHTFISFTADLSSGYIIVCISFDRYLRIARPHQGLSVKGSKLAICTISLFAFILSSPSLYVYGTEHVTFEGHEELIGLSCGTAERAKETVVPLIFNTLILVCFGIGVLILLTVYTLLGVKVRKWNKGRKQIYRRSEMFSPATFVSDDTESRDESHTDNACSKQPEAFSFLQTSDHSAEDYQTDLETTFQKPEFVRELSRSLDRNHFMKLDTVHMNGTKTLPLRKSESFKKRQAAVNIGRKSSMPSLTGLRKRIKISRTTIMFISATIAYVASHLPYACIKIALTLNHDMLKDMTGVEYAFFKFADHSYILSYAANPIIYSFLNPKYRSECKKLLMEVSKTIKCQSRRFYL